MKWLMSLIIRRDDVDLSCSKAPDLHIYRTLASKSFLCLLIGRAFGQHYNLLSFRKGLFHLFKWRCIRNPLDEKDSRRDSRIQEGFAGTERIATNEA